MGDQVMAADGSSVPPCAPQPNTPHPPPNDAKDRLERALARLSDLHDELATRHALLSSGMARADCLRQTMIAQLDAADGDTDLEDVSEDEGAQCEDEGAEETDDNREDAEPSLGATEGPTGSRDWTTGSQTDLEEQCEGGGGDDACEDEGGQCDDEGAPEYEGACEYADDGMDQRRVVTGGDGDKLFHLEVGKVGA
jgi:hypothetical protein